MAVTMAGNAVERSRNPRMPGLLPEVVSGGKRALASFEGADALVFTMRPASMTKLR
jgi:hypothetical protein